MKKLLILLTTIALASQFALAQTSLTDALKPTSERRCRDTINAWY